MHVDSEERLADVAHALDILLTAARRHGEEVRDLVAAPVACEEELGSVETPQGTKIVRRVLGDVARSTAAAIQNRKVDAAAYMKETNAQTFIAVQAESPEAIENLEEIAAVPGVDSIFVGPFDLSVSMGIPGKIQDPREVAAIERVVEVCRQRGIASGTMLFDKEQGANWIQKGMRFMAYSSDIGILADAAASAVSELKTSV